MKTKQTKKSKDELEQEVYGSLRDDLDHLIEKYSSKMDQGDLHSAILSGLSLDICTKYVLSTEEFLEIAKNHFESEREFCDEMEAKIIAQIEDESGVEELLAQGFSEPKVAN
jgi:hypothetical protein